MLTDTPGVCPTAQAVLHQRVSAQRRQDTLRAEALLGQDLRALSLLPCLTSEWWGGPQISAPLRGLLKKQNPQMLCRHYFIWGEKGHMGKGPHFKFKPVVQPTTRVRQNTSYLLHGAVACLFC